MQDQSRFNFTKDKIKALKKPDAGKRDRYHDTECRGLVLKITDADVRTFCLYLKVNGKVYERAIGRFEDTPIPLARQRADALRVQLLSGNDPKVISDRERKTQTFEALFQWYLDAPGKRRKDSTRAHYEWLYEKHLEAIASKRAGAINRAQIRDLHEDLTKNHGSYVANRALALISAVYNKAIKEELLPGPNPAAGIERNVEEARENRLMSSQAAAFLTALESYPDEDARDFFTLCLMTGARKSNVMAMRWADVSLIDAVWRIPETKNGRPITIPLLDAELEILARRQAKYPGEWVFPGNGKTGHLVEPKKAWRAILKAAGITFGEIRIHDLRRTLGSFMVDTGASLPMIGKALGHKSHGSTSIYARLALDPLREAKAKAHAEMEALRKPQPVSEKIVQMQPKRKGAGK